MKQKILSASITVEAAYVIPFILLITIACIHIALNSSQTLLKQVEQHLTEQNLFYETNYFEQIEVGNINYSQRLSRSILQIEKPLASTREEKTRLTSVLLKTKRK